MPEIEDFLASIEDDEDQEQQPQQIDPKKLGYALRQEQKEKKAMAKKLAELEEFQAQILAEKRTQALRTAGLNDFHAEVFSKFFEEVTPENVAAYKVRAGLEAAPAEEAEEAAAPEPQRGFSVTAGFAPADSSGAARPGPRMYTQQEWDRLAMTNLAEAKKVQDEGRIIRSDRPWAGTNTFE